LIEQYLNANEILRICSGQINFKCFETNRITSQNAKRKTLNKFLKSTFAFYLYFILSGCILAFGLIVLFDGGYFIKWSPLVKVPAQDIEIIGGYPAWGTSSSVVFIQYPDQSVFSCHSDSSSCWMADVIGTKSFPARSCNIRGPAFNLFSNRPAQIKSCREIQGGMFETGYHIFFVIDRDGMIWYWQNITSAYMVLVYPVLVLAGGYIGLLIASLVNLIRFQAKYKGTPDYRPRLVWVILQFIIPWLCLAGMILLYMKLTGGFPGPQTTNHNTPFDAASPQTTLAPIYEPPVSSEIEGQVRQWDVQITPNPVNPRIDFTSLACDATWKSNDGDLPCTPLQNDLNLPVLLLTNPSFYGGQKTGRAILANLTPYHPDIRGTFPRLKIHAGDHFRTEIACLDDSTLCNPIFTLSYLVLGEETNILGRWQVNAANRDRIIDLDLSRLDGKVVSLILDFEVSSYDRSDQTPFWYMPRIER
jgi:hypothetical protein